jgi:hypothetical protein
MRSSSGLPPLVYRPSSGLLLAGGVLLLWVCWKMWRELRSSTESPGTGELLSSISGAVSSAPVSKKTLRQAATQIVAASLEIVVRDTRSVLVHAHDGGIDHLHRRIMTGGQCIHDPVPNASPPPPHEAIVTSGAGTIGLGQVALWST